MNQHSNMYSGQVQQHGQSSYYSSTQSPSSAMQQVRPQPGSSSELSEPVQPLTCPLFQVTVPLPSSQLSLPNFGSGGGQPLLALPPTPPQAQPPTMNRQPPVSQPYRGIMGPNHSMMQPPSSKVGGAPTASRCLDEPPLTVCFLQMDMDLKLFGSGMDVKPGTPPVSARSTTPTSSPYRSAHARTHTH